MNYVTVKMKDGTEYCNPIWMWRPDEGWFTLMGEPDLKINFEDVETAREEDGMDLLEKRDRDLERLAVTRVRPRFGS